MPGRKTDVSDAAWLAQLAAHGLVRGSLVPPPPSRQLRDLTRTRTGWVRDRSREIARLERLLEDAGIKLSSVASELNGVSCRAMLSALIAGERDPVVLANLAKRRLRTKIPVLVEALTGRFSEHHAYLARMHLEAIERHDARIADIEGRIEVLMEPFQAFRELICSIPGISHTVADVVIAETGGDLTRFASPEHLTSWAGVCPGSNESAGRVKSTKTRKGDPHLKGAVGIAALAIARNPYRSYLGAKYLRIASRRGPAKAIVAIERAMLVIIWHMSNTGALYQEEEALEAAESYLDSGAFSKKGLFDQLTSESGEGFAKKDATFALNHAKANYNAEARVAAESYLDSGHFSHNSLMDQLTSEHGEQFTKAQAAQAVKSVGL